MPTPIEFVDGPLPDDRMPEDFPDASDIAEDAKDTTCWCDFCNLTGTPCLASRGL